MSVICGNYKTLNTSILLLAVIFYNLRVIPCVVLSNDAQNKKSSRIIIAPITSNAQKIYPFEAHVEVLGKEGKVMLDQLRSVDKARLGKYATSFDMMTMLEIETALKVALALA